MLEPVRDVLVSLLKEVYLWMRDKILIYDAIPTTSLLNGHICTDNTTTTPLIAGGVFTGPYQDTLNYNTITIGIVSDKDSAIDGLVVRWSADGVTVTQTDEFSILANKGKVFTFSPANQYVSIEYTNGAEAQGIFNVQTVFKKGGFKPSSHRIKDTIIADDDAELIKAVLTGEDDDGTFQNIQATQDGVLKVSDESSGLAIAKGDVTGTTFIHKFGNAPSFSTGDGIVSIWDAADGGASAQYQYNYSPTANIDSVSSSSVSDTVEIEVQGLDTDYNIVTQTITLQGQVTVLLPTALLRVFRMANVNGVDLIGNVFCYTNGSIVVGGVPSDTTRIRAGIEVPNNQTLMAIYTVPAGKTAYMRDWYAATAAGNKNATYKIILKSRDLGKVFRTKHVSSISDIGISSYQHKYKEPEVFAEKADIEMTVQLLSTGVSGASISAGFDIVLVDN